MRGLLLLLALTGLPACSPAFVMRAGMEEARILSRRTPITEVVADSATPEVLRGKLSLVAEVQAYADTALDLNAEDSYTHYSALDRDTLLLVLSASPKDRLEPHTWWFPIVGGIPYKGFFDFDAAGREQARLEARGLDTFLRPSAAFSTLGWLPDPLLSTLVEGRGSLGLAGTVIHELVHNTVYVSGHTRFNESLANFAEVQGAMRFFCARFGEESPQCIAAHREWESQREFSRAVDRLSDDLERLYAREDLSPKEVQVRREQIFERARWNFSGGHSPLRGRPLNNATVLYARRYYHAFDHFEVALASCAGDLRRFLDAIERAASSSESPLDSLRTPGGLCRAP